MNENLLELYKTNQYVNISIIILVLIIGIIGSSVLYSFVRFLVLIVDCKKKYGTKRYILYSYKPVEIIAKKMSYFRCLRCDGNLKKEKFKLCINGKKTHFLRCTKCDVAYSVMEKGGLNGDN